MTTDITSAERDRLEYLEGQVTSGFYQAGQALATIKSEGLYRAKRSTWKEYVQLEWNFGEGNAKQLIESAQIVEGIQEAGLPIPTRQQCNQLRSLPTKDTSRAWGEIVSATPRQKALVGDDTPVVSDQEIRTVVQQQKYRVGDRVSPLDDMSLVGTVERQIAGLISVRFEGDRTIDYAVGEVAAIDNARRLTYAELVSLIKSILDVGLTEENVARAKIVVSR